MPCETDLAWRKLNISRFHNKHQWQSGWSCRVWVGKVCTTSLYVIFFTLTNSEKQGEGCCLGLLQRVVVHYMG